MVLQAVASFIYNLVEQSWMVSTVLVKYILLVHIGQLLYSDERDLKHLEEVIMDYSRLVVVTIVFIGLISTLIDYSPEPVLKPFSQLVAVVYFAFLFWKF